MRGHWLFGFILFWAGHFCVDLLIGVWPAYKTLVGIDLATAGLIMACAGFFGDMTQLFFGPLGDRRGRKPLLLLSLILILPMALIGQLPSFCLLPCLLILYIGSGAFHPNAASLAATLRPHKKGIMVSLLLAAGYLGMACGPSVYRLLHHHLNGSTWPLTIPILLVLIVGLFYKAPPQAQLPPQGFWTSLRSLSAHRRPLTLLWISQICCYGLICSFLFLLPDILQARGYGDGVAFGGAHFSFILGAALTSMTLGWMADKYRACRLMPTLGAIAMIAVGCFLAFPTLSIASLTLILLALGGAMGLMNPLIITTGQRLSPERGGTVGALLMGGAWCFSYSGPLLAGLAATSFTESGPVKAMALLSILLAVPTLLGFFLPTLSRVPLTTQPS